ncbi:DUF2357 domain-containing protein [Macrococcoides canis]|uniref:DUF2357 domain-containing protein n=1 Tax=Macrococcoides canis TaxID=1855823 RepID=UPI00105C3298|nr:DUF2357 domain-containing protein [Macrococcus canis]TDM20532.1 DUF2357 domain-containing protein [Macrococcus canis]
MDMPFNLVIKYTQGKIEYQKKLSCFSSINEINFEDGNSIFKVKEYTPFKLSIISTDEYKLYFDLFDLIDDNNLMIDINGDKYLENNEIKIVDSSESINSIIVPGYYHIKIVGKETYHAVIEIIPKDFSLSEWKVLLDELLNENQELVKSLSNKTNSQLINTKQTNDDFISKINYIKSNHQILVNALNQIKENPKSTLIKEYRWLDKNISPPIDEHTISMHMKKPNKRDFLYSPKRVLNYDNKENRWLRKNLLFLSKFLDDLSKEISERIQNLRVELKEAKYSSEREWIETNINELKKSLNIVNRLIYRINMIRNEDWFKEISVSNKTIISYSLMKDNKYRTIYIWINEIFKRKNVIIYNNKLQYAWKRTDQLYEIWTFMKLIKLLVENNYYFEEEWEPNKLFIEGEITSDSKYKLKKENVELSVYYDSEVTDESKNTSLDNPLFTLERKNRPDIRIDIFIDGFFVQSIPIEIKYRKLYLITSKDKGNIEQMKSYTNFKSLHQLSALPYRMKKGLKPVNEVLVIYPNYQGGQKTTTLRKLSQEVGLEFIELSPSNGFDKMSFKIINLIDNAIENYFDYKKLLI